MNRECILSLLSIYVLRHLLLHIFSIDGDIFGRKSKFDIFIPTQWRALICLLVYEPIFLLRSVELVIFFISDSATVKAYSTVCYWPEHEFSLQFRQISSQVNPQMFAITKLRAIIFLWILNARGFSPFSRKTVFIPAWCCFHLAVKLLLLKYIYFLLLCDVNIYSAMFQHV